MQITKCGCFFKETEVRGLLRYLHSSSIVIKICIITTGEQPDICANDLLLFHLGDLYGVTEAETEGTKGKESQLVPVFLPRPPQ